MVWSFVPEKPTGNTALEEPATEYASASLVDRLRGGLPIEEFQALRELLALTEEDLAPLLGISSATLQRRKKTGRLGTTESERVVRFARLFGIATEVFESTAAACQWLKTPNRSTAGESPLHYADTEYGAREVENILGRIDHGVF